MFFCDWGAKVIALTIVLVMTKVLQEISRRERQSKGLQVSKNMGRSISHYSHKIYLYTN